MERQEITAAAVMEVDRLLAEGLDCETVATQTGISPYVVGVIAGDEEGRGRQPPPDRDVHHTGRCNPGVDAITLRRVKRMLEVGWLRGVEIAREAGIDNGLVSAIATGRQSVSTLFNRSLDDWECLTAEPVRCGICGSLVFILPCRACQTELITAIDNWVRRASRGTITTPFFTWKYFGLLTKHVGGRCMQDLMNLFSQELATYASAKDKREHLIVAAEKLFDQLIEPVDFPGPEQRFDPLLRAAVRPLVGRLHDEAVRKSKSASLAAFGVGSPRQELVGNF